MKHDKLEAMSPDELWKLHESVVSVLIGRIEEERALLETRLQKLTAANLNTASGRRPYPKVEPKYFNPENRKETWAGRGKQPRWLTAQLRSGKKLEEFRIRRKSA